MSTSASTTLCFLAMLGLLLAQMSAGTYSSPPATDNRHAPQGRVINGHAVTRRSPELDWVLAQAKRRGRVPPPVSSEWWRPLGLLFWAHPNTAKQGRIRN